MRKCIGLETSSIMPLLEITPRTLPLQQHIKEALERHQAAFFTDLYSVQEAIQQIDTSYNNAIKSINKARNMVERCGIADSQALLIVFVKALAENWYGREETLRWSDVAMGKELRGPYNPEEFFEVLVQQVKRKRQLYLSILKVNDQYLSIDCKYIQSYWITPSFLTDLRFKIRIIPNSLSLEKFFSKIQKVPNIANINSLRVNDVVDIYHLYSLYRDGNIREVWSCNQRFVKKHEQYLKEADEFAELFNADVVTIRRIE